MMLSSFSSLLSAGPVGSLVPIVAQLAPFSSDDTDGRSFWLPPAVSSEASQIDWVFYLIYWISVFFFVLIVGLMTYFVVKYRREKGLTHAPTPTHHTPLELTWTIIPLILVLGIFWVGFKGYVNLVEVPANAYEVDVTAQKWNWQFTHRNGANEINILRVPVGRPVKLIMNSTDVLHSLFIPAFRVKQDVVPGRYTYLWFQAERAGTYQLFCTEYCGTQHSQMTAMVIVYEEDDFQREITEAANWLDPVTEDQLHIAGLRVFARCASCHSLQEGVRMTGPSFWELHDNWGMDRQMEGGHTRTVDENYIRESILQPQLDIVATYPRSMPSFQGQLREKELRALINFVRRLDEVIDRKGKPVAGN